MSQIFVLCHLLLTQEKVYQEGLVYSKHFYTFLIYLKCYRRLVRCQQDLVYR